MVKPKRSLPIGLLLLILKWTAAIATHSHSVEDFVLVAVSTSIPFAVGYPSCCDLREQERNFATLGNSDVDLTWVKEYESHGTTACYNGFKRTNATSFSIRMRTCAGIHQTSKITFCKTNAFHELTSIFQTYNGTFMDVIAEISNKEEFIQILNMADMGKVEDQAAVGWLYEHGSSFNEQSTDRARHWYRRAADLGHIESSIRYFVLEILRLSDVFFKKWIHEESNLDSVVHSLLELSSPGNEYLVKNAALRGHSEGQFYLALLHLRPSANTSEFWDYLKRSAEGGFSPAQVLLSTLYADGPRQMVPLLINLDASAQILQHLSETSREETTLLWILRAFESSKDPFVATMLLSSMENDFTNEQRSQVADVVLGPSPTGFCNTWRQESFVDRHLQVTTVLRSTARSMPRLYAFSKLISEFEGTTKPWRNNTWLFRLYELCRPSVANPLGLLHVIAQNDLPPRLFVDAPGASKAFRNFLENEGRTLIPWVPSLLLQWLHKSETVFARISPFPWRNRLVGMFKYQESDKEQLSAISLQFSLAGSSIADLALYILYKTRMGNGEVGTTLHNYTLKGLERAVDDHICGGGFCAYTEMAEALEDGVLLSKDLDRSKQLYLQAKPMNDSFALFRLGMLANNPLSALRYFTQAAIHGSVDAFIQLAKVFMLGIHIQTDFALAGSLMKPVEQRSDVTSEQLNWTDILKKVDNATAEVREEVSFSEPSPFFFLLPIRDERTRADMKFVRGIIWKDYDALLEIAKLGHVEAQRMAVKDERFFSVSPHEVNLTKETWNLIRNEASAGNAHMACIEYQFWPGPMEESSAEDRNSVFSLEQIEKLADGDCADALYSLFVEYRVLEDNPIAKEYAVKLIAARLQISSLKELLKKHFCRLPQGSDLFDIYSDPFTRSDSHYIWDRLIEAKRFTGSDIMEYAYLSVVFMLAILLVVVYTCWVCLNCCLCCCCCKGMEVFSDCMDDGRKSKFLVFGGWLVFMFIIFSFGQWLFDILKFCES